MYRKEKEINAKEQLLLISEQLLNSPKGQYEEYEMEAKFGTRGIKRLTKQDYDNVIKKITTSGFICNNLNGSYTLKIQPEVLDIKTGQYKVSYDLERFRVDIENISNIQTYCKTNDLSNLIKKGFDDVKIMKKTDVFINDKPIQSANFDDFNFRVTYKKEDSFSKNSPISKELLSNWNKNKKIFRYINRVSFINGDYPFRIDLSIVKSSTKDNRGRLLKSYNIEESNVFNNPESYEIEVEVLSDRAKLKYRRPEDLVNELNYVIKIILSGLQKTNYPISYIEQKSAINDYMKVIHRDNPEKYIDKDRFYPSDFIGPSSKTLQIKNITEPSSDINIPNIRKNFSYCVTDKADGDRHLLFINDIGKIYLINTNMNVIFSGAQTLNTECFNTILDGELITHDKNEKYINTFAVFDIYITRGIDIRHLPFILVPVNELKQFNTSRLTILKELLKVLEPISITSKNSNEPKKSPINIISKRFYPLFNEEIDDSSKYSIFEACNYILTRIKDNLYEYNTDGLIFTPTMLGVGSNNIGEAGPLRKITWEYSFKWKPVEFNTIDFLVTTKKDENGKEIITPIFENGVNMYGTTQFNQYKTLILRVGFDERKHGYINPCQDLLDEIRSFDEEGSEKTYKPMQFFPTEPYDVQAGICNIMLEKDPTGNYQMFTEEHQVFSDETIVEFKYDSNRKGLWKWVPIRVRYDKTAEYHQGFNTFGNDYLTANNNWYSIHNPVTEKMITTGQDIPDNIIADDIYYNRITSDSLTEGLRDFHNLFVKKLLIQGVSNRGNTLIDYACGKAGDLPKWVASNLSFVFGIDISKDNIENRLNGACARYLNYKKTYKNLPYALFVNGNSSLNIRSGKALLNDKAISITDAVFGNKKPDQTLGKAVERQYGVGADGFNVSSCQFALHYMFENKRTFYNFIRNIAECTKINGYFIATCYDGKTIFNMLRNKKQGESIEIYEKDKKVWSVIKDYDGINFDDNESSLGYQISVYQETINQILPEYLVNYDFLNSVMEKYGFTLISRDEAKTKGLPEGSGMFIELYNKMLNNIKREPKLEKDYGEAMNMRRYEKDISFLNRYFVYKKNRTINAEQLTKTFLEQLSDEANYEREETLLAQNSVTIMRRKGKRLKEKIILQEATEVFEPKEIETKEELEEIMILEPKKRGRKKKKE
jgi:2-polyprenyl-3-methyl-5-hydroxy-6-metoxy-1,4-benzoquinol methylase